MFRTTAPITSKVKTVYPFEAKITAKGIECKVLLDQIRALDKQKLTDKIDSINPMEMLLVEEALKITLDLKI